MPLKVAINGFGRIGRNTLRALIESAKPRTGPVKNLYRRMPDVSQ